MINCLVIPKHEQLLDVILRALRMAVSVSFGRGTDCRSSYRDRIPNTGAFETTPHVLRALSTFQLMWNQPTLKRMPCSAVQLQPCRSNCTW
jgi:hypothetical protein